MKKITAILLGAGGRGMYSYAEFALRNPEYIEFVAVAEPNDERRARFAALHNIKPENAVTSWEMLLDRSKMADVVLICMQDKMHYEPAIKAFEVGYHVLLEKPMATSAKECIKMGEYAQKYNRIFSICHVLRYTDFYCTVKKLIDEGRVGEIVSLNQIENVGWWHFAHSYVRGMWGNTENSGPVILTKCCHDMDILLWMIDSDCTKISSFGSLRHFKESNAPEGAPDRCLDGCLHKDECKYYAPKTYLVTDKRFYPFQFMLCTDQSLESRMKTLETSRYGRCVYHCDNSAADNMVISMEFESGVTATFSVCAFSDRCTRTLQIMGTEGEIIGDLEKNEITITEFATGRTDKIKLVEPISGHSGGDDGIMKNFINMVTNDMTGDQSLTSAKKSVQSHVMAFAAEEARVSKKVVDIAEFVDENR